jgi:hypothetical protein
MTSRSAADHLRAQIEALAVLTRTRQTDQVFMGQGRYEAEAYLNSKDALDLAWQRLAEFEKLCTKNGVDPQAVYAKFGQPPRLSPAAKAWLEGRDAPSHFEPPHPEHRAVGVRVRETCRHRSA